MMSLILVAAFLGCDPPRQVAYGYARSYAAPACYRAATYYQAPAQQYYQAPAQAYQAPAYQPPAYNYSLVGDYLKQESAHDKTVEQNAKLDVLIKLLADRATPPPVQQAPPPSPVYQPVGVPSKASPQSPSFPSSQYPPPIPEKNQPSSFGGVGPPPLTGSPGGAGPEAVTQILRNRCAGCHAAPASKGRGVVLLDQAGNLAPMSPALMLMIQEDVKTGKMPQGGPELPDNELAIVSGWVGDHAPEIAAFLAQGIGR
jgi:hypothetical protein